MIEVYQIFNSMIFKILMRYLFIIILTVTTAGEYYLIFAFLK